VNFLFGWLLIGKHPFGRFLEKPRRLQDFAVAEAKAISISSSGRLMIDKKAATSHRSGLKVTWIFDRLLDLAQSSIPIEVWETRGGTDVEEVPDVTGVTGSSYEGWEWGAKNVGDNVEPRPGAKATRIWILKNSSRHRQYTVKARLRRGETYVHELVVHAWRSVKFGYTPIDDPGAWGPTEWLVRSSHHSAYPHRPGPGAGKHNLADIEADLLMFYLTFNQDWATFKSLAGGHRHDPAEILSSIKMNPRLTIQGTKWTDEGWIRKQINAERRRSGKPLLRE
jgi:hypothetical protein